MATRHLGTNADSADELLTYPIVNADIDASAAIAQSKISGLVTDLGNKVDGDYTIVVQSSAPSGASSTTITFTTA